MADDITGNAVARKCALLHASITDVEEDINKVEEKLEVMSGKMYKHFAEAQLDSLRLSQVIEDLASLKSSIRYAYRAATLVVGTALFGIFLTVITSSDMGG